MRDTLVVVATVFFFALLITTHVGIVVGLLRRPPRLNALAALIVFPLAPYLALRERMRARALLWLFAFAGYAAALVFALR